MIDALGAKALTALVAGLLALDRTAFLQSLASRPLPAAALTGWLLGNPEAGLWSGIFLEFLWIARHPVGGAIPPDETLAAVAAAAAACGAPQGWTPQALGALGVCLGLPFGRIGSFLDERVRRANGATLGATRLSLAGGDTGAIARAQRAGAARFFAAGVLGGAAAVMAGPLAGAVASVAPGPLERGMELLSALLPIVGVGSLLSGLPGWQARAALGLGALGGFGLEGWRGR